MRGCSRQGFGDEVTRSFLLVGMHRVLKVEDDGVSVARDRLRHHFRRSARREQQRAHYAALGFLRISAARSQVAQTTPSWLIVSW